MKCKVKVVVFWNAGDSNNKKPLNRVHTRTKANSHLKFAIIYSLVPGSTYFHQNSVDGAFIFTTVHTSYANCKDSSDSCNS